jgi:transposase InsO family protein
LASLTGSLASDYPNQAWHLDATVITTMDNRKAYLQILLDNFSRKIIAWKIHAEVSGANTTDLLRTAFSSLASVPEQEIQLIVDGGPENNNALVEAFIKEAHIRKLIARVDVLHSNSMIEAVNKTLKYRYIFPSNIPDLEHVPEVVERSVIDYNDRPHYALSGLTPNKTYEGHRFDKDAYRTAIVDAQAKRQQLNRRACPPCVPLEIEQTGNSP